MSIAQHYVGLTINDGRHIGSPIECSSSTSDTLRLARFWRSFILSARRREEVHAVKVL